jgi:methenyltetrahydromethanopterin cyclohydrolase
MVATNAIINAIKIILRIFGSTIYMFYSIIFSLNASNIASGVGTIPPSRP